MNEEIELASFLRSEPANIGFARDHGRASLVGLHDPGARACPCCERAIDKREISFFHPTEYLDVLGVGVKGYLFVLGAQTVLALVMALVYCLPSLFLRYYERSSLPPLQALGFWEQRSTLMADVQSYINLGAVVSWWVVFYLLRCKFTALRELKELFLEKKESEKVDRQRVKTLICRRYEIRPRLREADFTVLLKMPTQDYLQQDVHKVLEEFVAKVLFEDWKLVHPIFREAFPISKVTPVKDSRLLQELLRIEADCDELLCTVPKEDKELIEYLSEARLQAKKLSVGKLAERIQSRYCLVRFKYTCQKLMLHEFERIGYSLSLEGARVGLLEVPDEPLRWDNLGVPRKNKNIRQALILAGALLLCGLFLAVDFGAVLLFLELVSRSHSGYLAVLYPLVPLLQLALLRRYFRHCLKHEHGITLEQELISSLYKEVLCCTLFMAGALLLPFLTLQRHPFASFGLHESLLAFGGLVLLQGSASFIRCDALYNKVMQMLMDHRRGSGYIQRTANEHFEGIQFRPKEASGEWLSLTLCISLLGPIYPLLYLVILLSLGMLYCSEKVMLCAYCRHPASMRKDFPETIVFMLKFSALLHSCTSLVLRYPFFEGQEQSLTVPAVACDGLAVLLSVLLVLLPWSKLSAAISVGPEDLAELGAQFQACELDNNARISLDPVSSTSNLRRKIQKKNEVVQSSENVQVMHNNVISILDDYELEKAKHLDTPRDTFREAPRAVSQVPSSQKNMKEGIPPSNDAPSKQESLQASSAAQQTPERVGSRQEQLDTEAPLQRGQEDPPAYDFLMMSSANPPLQSFRQKERSDPSRVTRAKPRQSVRPQQ